jgi:adenosylcobinamide-GDP ribazoletransferase
LTLICLAGLAGFSIAWLAQARIGGYTGDVLGAVQQTVEVAILVAATVVL